MARYRYKARANNGAAVTAVADAANEDALAETLAAEGLTLISTTVAESRAKIAAKGAAAVSLAPTDLIFFTMEIGTSFGAGLPLIDTLDEMAEGSESRAIRVLCSGIAESVRGGESFADALKGFPKCFPDLYVQLVASAEKSGQLDAVLADLVRFLEWQKEIRGQIVSATVYPASLFGAVVGLVLVLTLFVFPQFLGTFSALGGDLPLPTRILLFIDTQFQAHKFLAALIAIDIPAIYFAIRDIPPVRWQIDTIKLKMPATGPLLTKVLMSRFSHNLAMMLASGVDFQASLAMCETMMGNVVLGKLVRDARLAVEQGEPLSDAMARGGWVPSLVRRMLKLGETTGSMETSLESVSQYYDKEVPRAIKRMFAIAEPVILAVMAGVVLFMASAVLLPLYGMLDAVGAGG